MGVPWYFDEDPPLTPEGVTRKPPTGIRSGIAIRQLIEAGVIPPASEEKQRFYGWLARKEVEREMEEQSKTWAGRVEAVKDIGASLERLRYSSADITPEMCNRIESARVHLAFLLREFKARAWDEAQKETE